MRTYNFITNMNSILLTFSRTSISAVPKWCSLRFTLARTMTTAVKNPIENAIRAGLTKELAPVHLEVVNESYMHNVPKGSETHFKVLVVSQQFDGHPLIKRHRMVNDIVKNHLDGDFVHALSIVAKTPKQWDEAYKLEPSPNCKGGFGK